MIKKIEPTFVESPKIASVGDSKPTPGPQPKWLEIEVVFDRNAKVPKFADELTFNYYILLKNDSGLSDDGKPNGKATLLTGAVTHVHTPQEKGLHAVAFVSPRTLAKLFDGKVPATLPLALIDCGVTVSGKEGLLAISSFKTKDIKGDKGWWDSPAAYTTVPGLVLNKDQTPFAPLAWDYFEPVKSKTGN
ncbi:MAG: Amuc_1102 family pilus-like protein [Verrucomicrobiae bacterium]